MYLISLVTALLAAAAAGQLETPQCSNPDPRVQPNTTNSKQVAIEQISHAIYNANYDRAWTEMAVQHITPGPVSAHRPQIRDALQNFLDANRQWISALEDLVVTVYEAEYLAESDPEEPEEPEPEEPEPEEPEPEDPEPEEPDPEDPEPEELETEEPYPEELVPEEPEDPGKMRRWVA